jgi:tartrate dehydratase alpha subunit/fumarate hydratase class I-like protein
VRTFGNRGIGPMGIGGMMNVAGVNLSTADRVPASYFVSVSHIH